MQIKVYQPHRKDFLINTTWGVPKDQFSKEEARHRNMILFHGRWVTRKEKKQLKDERNAYYTIRGVGVILILMSGMIFVGILNNELTLKSIILLVACVLCAISGVGLWRFKRWARNLATLFLVFTIFLPFLPLMSGDKGSPFFVFFGTLGLYYLYRNTAKLIFNEPLDQ